ncbi:MAG: hypothetical protein EOM78_20845, partial [Erysipelotrichia bacterium]|nr:hypothetical protein [Erysipelotrichia bacterium]
KMSEKIVNYEDEIDLRELFKIIWDKKIFIILFTLAITVLATVYAYSKTPIYEAKALVEIGEYKINNTSKNFVDDASTLEKKLSTLFVDMEKILKIKLHRFQIFLL